MGFEPTFTESCSGALTDWALRLWVQLALKADLVQLLQFHLLFLVFKNKKSNTDELEGKIMTEFVGLRAKIRSYLLDDGSEHKKAKRTKKCVIKREFRSQNYKDCNFNNKTILKSQ